VFAENPSTFQPGTWNGATLRMPVTNLDWNQCREACRRWGLVLPTESRWEYACRAGTSTRYFTGDDRVSLKGFANIGDVAFHKGGGPDFEPDFDDGFVVQAAIGMLKANAFGLHDVHGNAYEWCLDGYDGGDYGNRKARAGDGLRTPSLGARSHVTRGGGFRLGAGHARSALRSAFDRGYRADDLGFRPALSVTTF